MRVILNIAHSDDTPGKCSPDKKFREFLYSTKLCNLIKDALEKKGIDVDLIKQKTYYGPSKGLKQVVDDANKICLQYGAGNCLFVSVHVNAATNGQWSTATGWSIYTTKGKTNSDKLSEAIYKEAERILKPKNKKLRTDMSDGDHDIESDFYVLVNTKCPAVLTENFFQDNKSDVAYLTSEEGIVDIVNIHVNGIFNYVKFK